MPRFLVERTFPDGLEIPVTDDGAQIVEKVCATNAASGVTWFIPTLAPTKRRRTASTTARTKLLSAGRPNKTGFRSIRSCR